MGNNNLTWEAIVQEEIDHLHHNTAGVVTWDMARPSVDEIRDTLERSIRRRIAWKVDELLREDLQTVAGHRCEISGWMCDSFTGRRREPLSKAPWRANWHCWRLGMDSPLHTRKAPSWKFASVIRGLLRDAGYDVRRLPQGRYVAEPGALMVTHTVWERIAHRRAAQQDEEAGRHAKVQSAMDEKNRPLPEPPSIIDLISS